MLKWLGKCIMIDYTKREDELVSLTSDKLKNEIGAKVDISPSELRLYYNGNELVGGSNQLDLFEAGSESEVTAIRSMCTDMGNIIVRCEGLPNTPVNVSMSGSIRDLKVAISEILRVPKSIQLLSFEGTAIDKDDLDPLSKFHIVTGSEVILTLAPF